MKYVLEMSDEIKDERITMTIDADDVFEAINIATDSIENPVHTKLIKAEPIG